MGNREKESGLLSTFASLGFIEPTVLIHRSLDQLKVSQPGILHRAGACDAESSQILENAGCYRIETPSCFAYPENDTDSQDV